MRKNVVKKVTAVTLAATLAFGSLISAFADLGVAGGAGTYGDASANPSASASANPSASASANPGTNTPTPGTNTPTPPAEPEKGDVVDTAVEGVLDGRTTGWWATFTDYYTVKGNFDFTLKFKVFGGAANWNNFVAVFANNADRGADGYTEYAVARADAFGWGNDTLAYDNSSSSDWAAFLAVMKEAEVTVNVVREGNQFTYKYTAAGANGGTVTQTARFTADAADTMRIFLVTDGSIIAAPGYTLPADSTNSSSPKPTNSPSAKPTNSPSAKPTTSPSVSKAPVPKKLTVKETAGYDKATSYTLVKGKKVTLVTSISPAKASQKITATVNKAGKKVVTAKVKSNKVTITAKAAGKAKVTIASKAKASVKKVVSVKVVKKAVKAKSVTVKKAKLTIKRGKTGQINIKKITPADTTEKVTYKVTKKAKGVSVDKFGKVKVTKKAKKGAKAKVTVKVGKAKKVVTITVGK